MKQKVFRAVLLFALVLGIFNIYTIDSHASGLTWEGLREYLLEPGNGTRVSGGGTYDEYSNVGKKSQEVEGNQIKENIVQPVHEHSYIAIVTTEPTCIEEGVKTFTCSCGEKYTEPIEVVAHDYSKEIISQEATCTVNGKKLISCIVCNDTYEEDIEPLGHEKGEWVTSKRATCTENGEEVVNCKRCGEMLETKEVVALGHTDGEWYTTKKATLFDEGLNELRCATCEEVLETEVVPIYMTTWYIISAVAVIAIITVILTGYKTNKAKKEKAIK